MIARSKNTGRVDNPSRPTSPYQCKLSVSTDYPIIGGQIILNMDLYKDTN